MQQIRMYDRVKVVKLLERDRYHSGSQGATRPPQVGDTGTVVDIERRHDGSVLYYVELVDKSGATVWLATFHIGEISPI